MSTILITQCRFDKLTYTSKFTLVKDVVGERALEVDGKKLETEECVSEHIVIQKWF